MITQHIEVPIDEEELHQLLNGKKFVWEIDDIEVHLYKE
jgi:hypothetical protein